MSLSFSIVSVVFAGLAAVLWAWSSIVNLPVLGSGWGTLVIGRLSMSAATCAFASATSQAIEMFFHLSALDAAQYRDHHALASGWSGRARADPPIRYAELPCSPASPTDFLPGAVRRIRKIARDWNVPASGSGYVTRFDVKRSYLSQYQVREAGGRSHREYWIPADELVAFNSAIVGVIEVVASFP